MCEIKPTVHINMSKFRPDNRELKLFQQTEMSYVPFVRLIDHKTFKKWIFFFFFFFFFIFMFQKTKLSGDFLSFWHQKIQFGIENKTELKKRPMGTEARVGTEQVSPEK